MRAGRANSLSNRHSNHCVGIEVQCCDYADRSRWEYISLKSIDASETDDEDDRQDRTQVQEQVNLLRREVASEAHQYEEFVIKLIWVQIKGGRQRTIMPN